MNAYFAKAVEHADKAGAILNGHQGPSLEQFASSVRLAEAHATLALAYAQLATGRGG